MGKGILIMTSVPDLGTRDGIEQIREPPEVILVAYHPMEIDPAIIVGESRQTG